MPVKIIESGVAKVSAGDYHSLFLLEDGSVLGMGRNLEGQLGGTDTSDQQTPKVMVKVVRWIFRPEVFSQP